MGINNFVTRITTIPTSVSRFHSPHTTERYAMAAAGAARTLRRPSVIVSWNKYAETPASKTAALFCRCCDVLRFSETAMSPSNSSRLSLSGPMSANARTCGAQQPSLRQRSRQHKLAWDDSTRYSGSRGRNDPRVPNNDVADFRSPQFSYRQFDLWHGQGG